MPTPVARWHYCSAGAKYVTQNCNFAAFCAFLGHKQVEFEGVGSIWRDARRNSASNPASDMQNGWMATRLVPKRCDLGSLGVPGRASTPKPTDQPFIFFHHHQPCVAIVCLTQGPIWPIFSSSSAMCGHHVSQFGLIFFILIRFSKQWFQLGDPPLPGTNRMIPEWYSYLVQ